MVVVVGDFDITRTDDGALHQSFIVQENVTNGYSIQSNKNDIAILTLDRDIQFNGMTTQGIFVVHHFCSTSSVIICAVLFGKLQTGWHWLGYIIHQLHNECTMDLGSYILIFFPIKCLVVTCMFYEGVVIFYL